MNLAPIGAILTAVGAVGVLAALVTAHLLPTGLNPVRDPVSQYGISRFRGTYVAAVDLAALASIGGILVLLGVLDSELGVGVTVPVVLLAVFAAARFVIGFVPMDAPDAPPTSIGRWHNILAFLAFGAVTAAAFVAGGALHNSGFATAATWSTICGVVMAVGAVGLLLARFVPAIRRAFGLVERIIYVGFIAWFVVLAAVGATAV